MYLYGPPGNGKTHLAAAAVNRLTVGAGRDQQPLWRGGQVPHGSGGAECAAHDRLRRHQGRLWRHRGGREQGEGYRAADRGGTGDSGRDRSHRWLGRPGDFGEPFGFAQDRLSRAAGSGGGRRYRRNPVLDTVVQTFLELSDRRD